MIITASNKITSKKSFARGLRGALIGVFAVALAVNFFATSAHASSTNGTIDPQDVGHFVAKFLDDTGLGNQGINFGKFTTQPSSNITISDAGIRGFAWGELSGWMVMNCADTTSGCSDTNGNFKVSVSHSGVLSGFAWGENTGWINFGPFTDHNTSQVKIGSNGLFRGTLGDAGYAWSQNLGWIIFDCTSSDSCVETDYRPYDIRTSGGGGSGGGGGGATDVCPNIAGVQTSVPAGKVIDGTGQCVDNICPNVVDYSSVPLSSTGPFTVHITNANTIGFAIKTFDALNPSHTAGDFATENALNVSGGDYVATFNPSSNKYVLGFEDTPGGDNDFNDLVVEVSFACSASGNPCPSPSTLSDVTADTINNSPGGEQSLQTILNNAGYILNKTTDQKQYQVWNVPATLSVTVNTKFLNKFAGHSFVFGYYTDSSTANFVPIFKTASIAGSTTVLAMCVPNPSDYCPNIAGTQTAIPAGMALNTAGECVNIVYDVCPNIDGAQLVVPAGDMYDQSGNCVPIPPPAPLCTTNPSDPSCTTVPPSFCATNPNDPSCLASPSLCETNPSDPSCATPSPCLTDPQLCNPPPNPVCVAHPELCSTPPGGTPEGGPSSPPSGGGGSGGDITDVLKRVIDPVLRGLPSIASIVTAIVNFVLQHKAITAAIGASGFLSFLLANLSRIWEWLLWVFGFAKKKNKWGTVYDSVTKYPLDPAYVVAHNTSGAVVAESITDLDGRYGFLLPPGLYRITAQKTNYTFPSTKLAGLPADIVYDNLYFGGTIIINDREQVVSKNIPMDPIAVDWNEQEKRRRKLGTYSRRVRTKKLIGVLFYGGFALALISFFITFSLIHAAVIAAYLLLIFSKAFSAGSGSLVRSRTTNAPIPYAVVKIFSATNNREVLKRVTSLEGRFFGLVPNGHYYLTVEKKTDSDTYVLVHTSDVFKVGAGVIDRTITI